MPRNSSGTMSAPAGQPAVSGTTISSATFNTLVGDLIGETTDSLSRSGKGSMLASLRGVDGSAAVPAYSFTNEVGSGIYRAGASDVRLAVGGVDALKLVSGGVAGPLVLAAGSTAIQVTLTNGFLLLQGNQSAGATPPDVATDSSVARTAGNLFGVRNFGANKLFVDYQGLLQLVTPAAALQPASMVTAITPDAGHTAASGLAYWKDAGGMVHVKGVVVSGSTVSGSLNLVSTNPLPAGFRPLATRHFGISSNGNPAIATITTTGTIGFLGAVTAGNSIWLDSIHFLAEA